MQTSQLLVAKTLIAPEGTQVPTQVLWIYNHSETEGSVIDALNTLDFSTRETRATQTQFYKVWVQSHHSVVSQLLSHVSYHPWPEQWLWSVTFKKILPTFCGHFVGNSQPVSISFPSLTPKKMSSTLLHMFSSM